MSRLILCIALIAIQVCLFVPSLASACTLTDYRPDERPDPPDVPTVVTASFVVTDFLGVDDANQRIDVELVGTFSWRDPRLVGMDGCRFELDSVWVPNAVLLNSSQPRISRAIERNQVAVEVDGLVVYQTHFSGLISSYHDLADFPFDRHDFEIQFGSIRESVQDLQFVADTEQTWIAERLNIEGWVIEDVSLSSNPMLFEQIGLEASVLTLKISSDREHNYFIYRIFIPLMMVVAMSWVIFWIPPSHFEFQIGLGATSMLTAIAFSLSISGQLPRLGYLTILDKILIWSVFLVFLSIIEALISGRLAISGKDERAVRLDNYSRWIFPVFFFGGWAFFVFAG